MDDVFAVRQIARQSNGILKFDCVYECVCTMYMYDMNTNCVFWVNE